MADICMGDEISVVTLTQKILSASNGPLWVTSFLSTLYVIKGSANVRRGWNRVSNGTRLVSPTSALLAPTAEQAHWVGFHIVSPEHTVHSLSIGIHYTESLRFDLLCDLFHCYVFH